MMKKSSGRLAIHRRSDEISFLQQRLRALHPDMQAETQSGTRPQASEQPVDIEALIRQRDLADELLHTRQTEPLGETLQRRLAMAERVCRDLIPQDASGPTRPEAYRLAEIERLALEDMLKHWWAWLREA